MKTIKKIAYYIFVPLFVIVGIIKIMFSKNPLDYASDSLNNAQNEDDDLANTQNAHNSAANDSLAKADEIAKEKEEIKNNDIDLNWHNRM